MQDSEFSTLPPDKDTSTPINSPPEPDRLQPLLTPEPGRPFINRIAEIEFIHSKVRPALQGNPMSLAVVCFWGTFGIGKSWLLGELERRYRRSEQASESSHPTLAARLDLGPERLPILWRGGKLDVRGVVHELWKQLAAQVGAAAPDPGPRSAEEYVGVLIRQVTDWLAHATPILLLDTMDVVAREDEAAFFWLEEHLVEPLALTDRVLFVLAGRGELRRWKRFQVRRKVDSYPLPAFDAETAGREVGANAETSAVLYRHAFGHPLATEFLGRLLEEQGLALGAATAQAVEAALTPELVRRALVAVDEQIFEKIPAPLDALARRLCVLRWVNEEPLQKMSAALGLAPTTDPIDRLLAGHLLYWDIDAATYTFAPAVRRLLAHALELQAPEVFLQAHLAAYDYHRGHLESLPSYLARYLPEAAYHHARAARGGPLPEDTPAFFPWWRNFLEEKAPRKPEAWRDLAAVLENDSELRETLPAAEYEDLCKEARLRAAAAQ